MSVLTPPPPTAHRSLAWLYRQLRKRTRRGVEIQLQVIQQQQHHTRRAAAATAAGRSPPTAVATATATAVPVPPGPALTAQQAALAEARAERARALEELAEVRDGVFVWAGCETGIYICYINR